MGIALSYLSQNYFAGKPAWSADQIPDLSGKIVIVTGGNAGIGKETVKAVLEHNAKVYIAARSREKSEAAIRDLQAQTGKNAHFIQLDLANMESVRAAAEEFQTKEKELHILFNNGGVMAPPIDALTAQGFDLQFGTNVLGHFYFTKLLLPTLLSTAQTAPNEKVRVVNVSSWVHMLGSVDFNTFKDSPTRQKKGTRYLYYQSKFGNILFSNELARRYGDQGIVSTSLHPGNIDSDLRRHMSIPAFLKPLAASLLWYPINKGALTQLRAGTAPEAGEWNGKYLVPWARLGKPRQDTNNTAAARQLWEYMEEQVRDV